MSKFKQSIKRRGIFVLMLLAGFYYGCMALWGLTNTLLYYHEAVTLPATVIDVRQRPFESYSEALHYGNLPWQGEIAYRPILTFVMPAGIRINSYAAPDWDNTDYKIGEQVELITHPHDPNQAHVNKWKFLWGADCMQLGFALVLAVPSWLVLFPNKRRKNTPGSIKKKEQKRKEVPSNNEPSPATKNPRTPRKKKETDPDAPKKPRTPRKKKEADPNAPAKPRKPRKKKAEE